MQVNKLLQYFEDMQTFSLCQHHICRLWYDDSMAKNKS